MWRRPEPVEGWYVDGVLKNSGSTAFSFTYYPGIVGNGSTHRTFQLMLKVRDNEYSTKTKTVTVTIRADKRNYFVTDHLGNVRATVDQNGAVIGYDDFYPYGQVMPSRSSNTANANDIYKFTGHERDAELGLDYMLARNYDPEIGRFLSVDPLYNKYPGLSPYMYVEGNPLRLIDPDGMQSAPPNGWLASGRVGLGATYGTIGNVIKGTIEAAQSFFSISSNVEVLGSTIASANIEVTGSEAAGNNVSGSATVLGSSNSFGEPNNTDVGDNYNLAVDFKKVTIGVSENQNGVTKYSMDFQHGPTKMGGSVSSDGTIEVRQNTDVSFDFGNFAKGSVGILNKLQINVNKGFEKASETLSTILGTE